MSTDISDALALTCLTKYTADDPVMKANIESNREKIRRFKRLMGSFVGAVMALSVAVQNGVIYALGALV